MAFPISPTVGLIYASASGTRYRWSGVQWLVVTGGSIAAATVTSTAVGDVSSTDVQSAIGELSSEKLALLGGTMLGPVNMGGQSLSNLPAPTAGSAQAATAAYAESVATTAAASATDATARSAAAAAQTTASAALPAASYTAADVLAKVITVGGSGSNLDADKLDGLDSTAFTKVSQIVNDLVAGGSAVPLSAEQGKVLNQLVLTGVGTTTTYANLAARNSAININDGDMAYLTDNGSSTWELQIRLSGAWVKLLSGTDLSASVASAVQKDGSVTMTGNLPMGGNKVTGMANGAAATDAVAYGQISAIGFSGSASDLSTGTIPDARLPAQGGGDAMIAIGGGNVTLAASGVTAATYGSATQIPIVVFDAKGRATSATNQSVIITKLTESATAPASPSPGDQWWNTVSETLSVFINSTIQWLDVSTA